MELRCRPGDLAVVSGFCETAGLRDRYVVVDRFAVYGDRCDGIAFKPACRRTPTWICRPASGGMLPWSIDVAGGGRAVGPVNVSERPIADAVLRPVRDPGNDAQDETLSWLPVPHRETA